MSHWLTLLDKDVLVAIIGLIGALAGGLVVTASSHRNNLAQAQGKMQEEIDASRRCVRITRNVSNMMIGITRPDTIREKEARVERHTSGIPWVQLTYGDNPKPCQTGMGFNRRYI